MVSTYSLMRFSSLGPGILFKQINQLIQNLLSYRFKQVSNIVTQVEDMVIVQDLYIFSNIVNSCCQFVQYGILPSINTEAVWPRTVIFIQPLNRINNYHFQRMKSNAYALIDAHIIRCRLHHQNNLKYSVALKSGKQHEVSTEYKPSKDLIIEMDAHLSLQVDKHAFDNFPKLTLIVNSMGENGQRKNVGTTFANFRKEGAQVFQVSECSCKDKAFQVQVGFSLKMIEAKVAKPGSNKNQNVQDKKASFFSYQPTPRESRELKLERFSKPLKDNITTQSEQKTKLMNRFNSQKIINLRKEQTKKQQLINKQSIIEFLQKEVLNLTEKVKRQQQQILQIKRISFELQQYRSNNQFLKQLLTLEQQKSEQAIKYLSYLQTQIFNMKDHVVQSSVCIPNNFKVIQEKDEFIEINQQLQGQLQMERYTNNMLYLEIDQLKRQLDQIKSKYRYQNSVSEISLHSVKNSVALQTDYQVPVPSFKEVIVSCQNCKERDLVVALSEQLQLKIVKIQQQISKLQVTKRQLQQDITKIKPIVSKSKKSPSKPTLLKKQEARKIQKGTSSDKNWKPPKQTHKKVIPTPVSNIQISSKKSLGVNSTNSADLVQKPTKIVSTEIETKTERNEPSQDFSNKESIKQSKVYNQIVYFTDEFDS